MGQTELNSVVTALQHLLPEAERGGEQLVMLLKQLLAAPDFPSLPAVAAPVREKYEARVNAALDCVVATLQAQYSWSANPAAGSVEAQIRSWFTMVPYHFPLRVRTAVACGACIQALDKQNVLLPNVSSSDWSIVCRSITALLTDGHSWSVLLLQAIRDDAAAFAASSR